MNSLAVCRQRDKHDSDDRQQRGAKSERPFPGVKAAWTTKIVDRNRRGAAFPFRRRQQVAQS